MSASFSPSRFNLFLDHRHDDCRWIVANSFTGAIQLVDDELLALIRSPTDAAVAQLNATSPQLLDKMKAGGFIVRDGVDELRRLARRYAAAKYDASGLTLTVIPTTGCNLACDYCYEDHQGRAMTDAVIAQATQFVAQRAGQLRCLSVMWFGGEPLLGIRVLVEMSRQLIALCDARGIAYRADIITNGTLLDGETADALVAARIGGVQITVDGPPPIHNARRFYAGTGAASFDDVIAGIRSCRGKLPVNIRVNVDRSNVATYPELVTWLSEQELIGPSSGNSIALGYVKDWTDKVGTERSHILTTPEFEQHSARLRSLVQGLQAPAAVAPTYAPFRPRTPCAAVNPNCYVVMPDGGLRKCWVHVGGPAGRVGDLGRGIDDELAATTRWEGYDPTLEPACTQCAYLPVCAGGCPYEMMERPGRDRQHHCAYVVAETHRALRDAVSRQQEGSTL